MTADGHAKVGDFGIAHIGRLAHSQSWHTAKGFVAGTVPYMAPEQIDGERCDPRIDIYALGAVLYLLVTGKMYLPFDERDTPRAQVDNITRIASEPVTPPSTHNPAVPPWLDRVILQALAKRAEDRFKSAAELANALRAGPSGVLPAAAATVMDAALLSSAAAAPPPGAVPPPSRGGQTPPPSVRHPAAPPPPPPKRFPLWAAVLLVVVLVLGILGVFLTRPKGSGNEVAGATVVPAASATVALVAQGGGPTAATEPTATRRPTNTATPRPTDTDTPEPTITPSLTPEPTDTPTDAPLPTAAPSVTACRPRRNPCPRLSRPTRRFTRARGPVACAHAHRPGQQRPAVGRWQPGAQVGRG